MCLMEINTSNIWQRKTEGATDKYSVQSATWISGYGQGIYVVFLFAFLGKHITLTEPLSTLENLPVCLYRS